MRDRRRFLQRLLAAGALASQPAWLAACAREASAPKSGPSLADADAEADTTADAASEALSDSEEADVGATDAASTSDVKPPKELPDEPVKAYDDQAVLTDWTPDAVTPDELRFALGVQAGAMRDDEALLWTHFEAQPDDSALELRVWRDAEAPSQVWLAVQSQVDVVEGYVRAPVTPLLPDTWYSYCFVALGTDGAVGRSPVGKFRTAFAQGVKKPLHIGGTACTRPNFAPFQPLQRLAEAGIDVFCHLGDMVYADSATNRDQYRGKWRTALQDPGYRAILPACGQYRTWDDHEVTDNSKRYSMPAELKQEAIEAFFENGPLPRPEGNRLWDSYRWGHTAEFFVLDSRNERKPETREGPDAEYLSKAQMAWLKQALWDSPCHFKVIFSSVPITGFPSLWPYAPDRWQGYPAQRQELLDWITGKDTPEPIKGVWFLSGDLHLGMINRLAPEGSGPESELREVLLGPGGNENGIAKGLLAEGGELLEALTPKTQFLHVSTQTTATRLLLDPNADTVRVVYEDGATGAVLYDQVLAGGGA